MTKEYPRLRSWAIVIIMIAVFGGYFFALMRIQIVDAEYYSDLVQGVTVSNQHIKAVRGEILDRNGIPLIKNEMSYSVVIDRAFLPYNRENEIILELINLFQQSGSPWIDNLPITKTEPFAYIKGMEKETETLKAAKNAQPYTTPEDLMYWLIKEYELEEFTKEEARKIIGVRYEMERRDFSNRIPYTFAEKLSSEMIVGVKENSFRLPGVEVVSRGIRQYPIGDLAPHILGLTGPLYKEEYDQLKEQGQIYDSTGEEYDTSGYTMDDIIGKSGIEKALEETLRGQNGLREIKLDANGQVVSASEAIVPVAGNTVVLTIDTELQQQLYEALESQIKHLNQTQPTGRGAEAHSGAAVLVNPKTGEILAAVTYPSYSIEEYKEDYNEVANRDGKPLINRAFMGEYTPGSIYKPVVALAGLTNDVITDSSTFNCTGRYYFFAPSYTPKCLSTHGHIGVNNAIGWSCNIFFYETGRITGIDEIDRMAKALGLGEKTGVEVAEESLGQRSNPAVKESRGAGAWYGADTIQTAIGQLDNKFTPLQLASYVATIANRGKRMELTLVKEIKDYPAVETVKPFEPVVAESLDFVSRENFEITINGMKNATVGSAGGTFRGYPVEVASKTGTPQVTEEKVNSTFIAFAPAVNPELAIAVVIEEGWQGYTGAPVAKAVFDSYFKVDHRGAIASGPQRLEDLREEIAKGEQVLPTGLSEIDFLFPEYINGMNIDKGTIGEDPPAES